MELKNKVVLITGSSDGIGAETAKTFAKEGCKVIVTYNSQKSKAEEVFNECSKLNESLLVKLDITDENSIKKCVEDSVDKFGAIDILVNNAGIVLVKDLVESSNSEIEKIIDVNLTSLVKMTKAVLPYFKGQDDGIVINISSILGKEAFGEVAVYCATKSGVIGFTKAMAEEFDKNKIRFYCVNPRGTSTKMNNYHGDDPKKVANVILDVAKEKLGKKSGEDFDSWNYF